jgi:hypothetical protein
MPNRRNRLTRAGIARRPFVDDTSARLRAMVERQRRDLEALCVDLEALQASTAKMRPWVLEPRRSKSTRRS